MSTTRDDRLANLLATLATGLSDQINAITAGVAALDGSAPAALVAMLDFSPAGSVHLLSQIVGLTHSGTVRLVDRLVDAGLARRGPGRDARSITVSLTREGKRLARRVREARLDESARVLAELSDQQRDELLAACELVVAHLTRDRLDQRAAGSAPPGGALCRLCDFAACGRPAGLCPAAQ
jgi:MarR family transcriptional regulator, negative regulator of the multidrug operon emrRAB